MARSGGGNEPSQRMLRVGEEIRHALAGILQRGEIIDDVLTREVITVAEVRMSPDLKLATVYVMPLGGKDAEGVVKAFARNAKYIKGAIARQMRGLRFVPALRFRADERFGEAERIERLLKDPKVARDLSTAEKPAAVS